MYNTRLKLFSSVLFGDVLVAVTRTNFSFFFGANIEITRVRKSNESEIAVMKAALKKEQTKSASLEMSLQQKVCFFAFYDGNFGQFCSFCPILPRVHAEFYYNVNQKK